MVVDAKRLGFSEATIWRNWMPKTGMVAKYYREQGLCVYDPAVTDEFLQKLEGRCTSGEVSYNYLRQICQIARRLNKLLVRYEKKATNYMALLQFACAVIVWRKLFHIHR